MNKYTHSEVNTHTLMHVNTYAALSHIPNESTDLFFLFNLHSQNLKQYYTTINNHFTVFSPIVPSVIEKESVYTIAGWMAVPERASPFHHCLQLEFISKEYKTKTVTSSMMDMSSHPSPLLLSSSSHPPQPQSVVFSIISVPPSPLSALRCCDVFVYSTAPPLLHPLSNLAFSSFSHSSSLSTSTSTSSSSSSSSFSTTLLPVFQPDKASPLFVGASFWRGRPVSNLIVHSLAFACHNST